MAYLHCHGKMKDGTDCGWSQDDFWDKNEIGNCHEGYTPLKSGFIKQLKKDLFEEKIFFDRSFFNDNPGLPCFVYLESKKTYCNGKDFVAWDLERRAKRIRGMLVKTYDEFVAKKDELVCPKCGQKQWDID